MILVNAVKSCFPDCQKIVNHIEMKIKNNNNQKKKIIKVRQNLLDSDYEM